MPFTNQEHLQHLLRPYHYTSEEQYRLELERLFLPAWHPIAALKELAAPGSFFAFEVLETPVVIRNFAGELRAFLNRCPQSGSPLVNQARGQADSLRCRCHSRGYDVDGLPLDTGEEASEGEGVRLCGFRLETCADLLFINLSDDGGSLRDWLGPMWESLQSFAGDYQHCATWEEEFPCNWKVVLENSLESYHIPQVHPETFKMFPPETNAWHELDERYSSFKTVSPRDFWVGLMDWAIRRLGAPVTDVYWHRVLHPHTTAGELDATRMIQCVFPTGPETCRYRTILFALRGKRRGPVARLLSRLLASIATQFGYRVFKEDASIYAGVQRGLRASPHNGVIGTREERIFYFQQYVLDRCGEKPGMAMSRATPLASRSITGSATG